MKRSTRAAVAALLLSASLAFGAEPEIAYRFLGDYVAVKEAHAGDRTGAYVMYGIGGALLASSAAAWFYGDDMAKAVSGQWLDPEVKMGLTVGFGVGGAVSLGIATGLLYAPVKDYRLEYRSIFGEDDPELREALAAATLQDLAVQAKQARVVGAIGSLLVPTIAALAKVYRNTADGRPWESGLVESISSQSWSLVGGLTSLLSKSKEELLYERYLAARAALYDPRY